MTRCCDGPLGAVRPLDAPSWLIAEPRTTASTSWPLRRASDSRSSTRTADALGPADAVGRVGERLAAAVRGQAALAGELDQRGRGRHDGDAAGQRERALPVAQRLRGQVQRDQRGRARGVHGDRGAFEAERVGDPAGHDARRRCRCPGSPRCRRRRRAVAAVVVVHDAGEHAGPAAAQGNRVDARAFERLPGRFQQQSLLRRRSRRPRAGSSRRSPRRTRPRRAGSRRSGCRRCRGGRGPGGTAGRGPSRGRPGTRRWRRCRRTPGATGRPASRRHRGSGSPCRRSRSGRRRSGARRSSRWCPAASNSSSSRCAASASGGRVVEDQRGGQPQAGRRRPAGCAAPPR